jgi:hypothetical protein
MLIVQIYFEKNGYSENIITEVNCEEDKITKNIIAQQIIDEIHSDEHMDKMFFKDHSYRKIKPDALAKLITKVTILDKK